MLHDLHRLLMSKPFTRTFERKLVRGLRRRLGCPEAYDDLARICRKVHPSAILDVGSHEGSTVDLFLADLPGQRIHAFEPTPTSFEILRQRMAEQENVSVHRLAISDRGGTMRFFLNADPVANSLLDNEPTDDLPFGDMQRHVERIDVDSVRLDDWVPAEVPVGPIVVKADVQGAEMLLIDGAREVLSERVAAFYTEVCLLPIYDSQATFGQVHDVLTKELGLALYNIYPCGRDSTGRVAWTDALWVRPDWVLPL